MVCLVFGWFVGGLASLWPVCGWCGSRVDCGWFVDSLAGLYVVWVVCVWFGWFVGDFKFYS